MIRRFFFIVLFVLYVSPLHAETSPAVLEQSLSDSLDLWREGRYEQLYERLAHRGKTSKESFLKKMAGSTVRPACCWQKMQNFKVLNEKRTEATVYAKIGFEGGPGTDESCTREFKLTHEEQLWKMQMNDVLSLSGASAKKNKRTSHKSKKHQ